MTWRAQQQERTGAADSRLPPANSACPPPCPRRPRQPLRRGGIIPRTQVRETSGATRQAALSDWKVIASPGRLNPMRHVTGQRAFRSCRVSAVILALVGCQSTGSRNDASTGTSVDSREGLTEASGGVLGSGGMPATGGVLGSAGALATGGSLGSGGSAATGGSIRSGGAPATGGALGSAGALATGGSLGSAGALATGGSPGSAGALASGGVLGSAGALATGGALGSGGSLATGGSIRSGGASATGGALGSGGSLTTGGALGSGGSLATGGDAGVGGAAGTGGSKNTADAGRDAATCTGWSTLVHLTPQQLKDLLAAQDVYLINVRSPNAPNIAGTDLDLQTGSDATPTVTAIENFVNHNTCADIVIYCVTGGTSQRVATQLISDGYLRVRDLQGGITAWQAQGFPVVQPDGGH